MNKAERVNEKKKKRGQSKVYALKRPKGTETKRRQRRNRQPTHHLWEKLQTEPMDFFFFQKKDRRRVIASASNCLQNSGTGMKAKNINNFNEQQQNKTTRLARSFIYYEARSSWWKYVDETKETTTERIRARRRTPVSSFQAGERMMRSRLSLQRLQIGTVETVSDGESIERTPLR